MLTIYYDSHCPMCAAEMRHLKRFDKKGVINLIDLHQLANEKDHTDIHFDEAMKILHGKYQGNVLKGLEVTHRAWTLVGFGVWVAPLNWPVIKPLSHFVYVWVAKHRHTVSSYLAKWLNLESPCKKGVCYAKKQSSDHWRK